MPLTALTVVDPDKDPDELPVPEVIEADTGAEEEVTTLPYASRI